VNNRLVPLILAVALFMENMDSTVIATSLASIAHDIGSEPIALKLALTAYLVALAIFIPISAWMADRWGARNVFRVAIVIFIAGSVACAASNSLLTFVGSRFLQGFDRDRLVLAPQRLHGGIGQEAVGIDRMREGDLAQVRQLEIDPDLRTHAGLQLVVFHLAVEGVKTDARKIGHEGCVEHLVQAVADPARHFLDLRPRRHLGRRRRMRRAPACSDSESERD